MTKTELEKRLKGEEPVTERKSIEELRKQHYSSKNVDSNYINSFLKDSQNFTSSANSRYKSARYSNASSLYSSQKTTADDLRKRANTIKGFLQYNPDKFKGSQDILDYIDNYQKSADEILKSFKGVSDYYSQWENEDAYNYSVSQAEKKEKYSDMTDEELEEELSKAEGVNSLTKKAASAIGTFASKASSGLGIESEALNDVAGTLKEENLENDSNKSLIKDEKTSRTHEKLEELPDDVKSLIDEYTALDRESENASISRVLDNVSNALSGGSGISSATSEDSVRKNEIAKQLESSGVDNWKELVEYNRIRFDEKLNEPIKESYEKAATEHPWLTSLGTSMLAPAKALGLGATVKAAMSGNDKVNKNSPYYIVNDFINGSRNTVMENHNNIDEATGIDKFDQIYSTVMSGADSVFNGIFSGGNMLINDAVIIAEVASDTAQEVAQNGGSLEESLATGILNAAFEVIFENVSIGNIKGLTEKGIKNLISAKGFRTLLTNTLKSAGVNASEEAVTEAADIMVDYLVNGGASNYAQSYEAYLSGGYSDNEAREKAGKDMIYQVAMSGIGGAIQGLFFGFGGSLLGAGLNTAAYKNVATEYTAEDVANLQNIAREFGISEKRIDVGDISTKKGLNKLTSLIGSVEDAQSKAARKTVLQKAKSYGLDTTLARVTDKGFSKLQKRVGEIDSEIESRSSELQDSIYKNAMKQHLVEQGMNENDARLVSHCIIKSINDKDSLNPYEKSILNTKQAQVAYDEFISGKSEWIAATDAEAIQATKELIDSYKVFEQEDKPAAKATENVTENAENITVNEKNPQQNTENVTESVKPSENTVATEEAKAFASQMETPEKSAAALKLYNAHLDNAGDYKTTFDYYYNAGLKGIGTFEQIEEYKSDFMNDYPEYWRKEVFNAGRADKQYTPGVNKMFSRAVLNFEDNAQMDILDTIGKKYDISFIVVDELKDEGGALNGIQLSGTNKIIVSLRKDNYDLEGGLYLRTAGHECFHLIEEWNPEAAQELRNKVIEYLKQSDNYDYSARVKEYAKTYSVDADTTEGLRLIHSEMAADCMFDVFSNEKFVKKLVKENKTLAEKIENVLSEFISTLKKLIKKFANQDRVVKELRDQTKLLEEINESFISALETASANMKNGLNSQAQTKNTDQEDGVRCSRKDYFVQDKYFDSQINKWNELSHGSFVKVGIIGENHPLVKIGMPDGVLRYDVSKLQKNMKDHDDYLTTDLLKAIPDIIANPIAISQYSTQNTVSVFGNYFVGKSPMMVGVTISKDNVYNDVTKVRTYNARKDVGKLITDDTVLYLNENKKRTQEWFLACGIQVPLGGTQFGFIRSISQNTGKSNTPKNSPGRKSYKSERFNENNPDTRFSRKLSAKSQQLLDENPEFAEEINEYWADAQSKINLFNGWIPYTRELNSIAKRIKDNTLTMVPVHEIAACLREIYNALSDMTDSDGYNYVSRLALNLAEKTLDNSKILDDVNAAKKEQRDALLSYLRGNKFYLSPAMSEEIKNTYGSLGDFNKAIFGKGFSFSQDNTLILDSVWGELCKEFPQFFESGTPDIEQPLEILAALRATEYEYGLLDSLQYDAQAKLIVTQILDEIQNIPVSESMIEKMAEKHQREYYELKDKTDKRIKKLVEDYTKEIENTEGYYRGIIASGIENRKKTQLIKQIRISLVRLSDILAHGSKTRNIPTNLVEAVRELCESLTITGTVFLKKGKKSSQEMSLAKNIKEVKDIYEKLIEGVKEERTPQQQYIIEAIGILRKKLDITEQSLQEKGAPNVSLMELEDLQLVDNVIKAIIHEINQQKRIFIDGKMTDAETVATDIAGELRNPKDKRYFDSELMNGTANVIDKEKWKFLKPVYVWRMLGSDTLAKVMKNINDGQYKCADILYDVYDKRVELFRKYSYYKWCRDEVSLTFENGNEYIFGIEELMTLYVAAQREQYLPHLLGNEKTWDGEFQEGDRGGFVFKSHKRRFKNSSGQMRQIRDAGAQKITKKDLKLIEQTLTEEQKAFANEMRDILSIDLAGKGNEVSRKLYGFNLYTERFYFPIKVSEKYTDTKVKKGESSPTIAGKGITHALQLNATKPVVLEKFTDMWAQNVKDMAEFCSFAAPLDAYQKVFNYRTSEGKISSLQAKLTTAWGDGLTTYINNFIRDANGGIHSDSSPTFSRQMISKFKKVSVTGSLSVAVQQWASMFRAMAHVDLKYFAKTTLTKRDYEELQKYAPVAKIKAMGFFDTSISQSTVKWLLTPEYETRQEKVKAFLEKKNGAYRGKVIDDVFSKLPELMDELTWCHIWNAVKAEQAEVTGLKGEDLLQKAGERFTEVIELTQVYDSVFSKSELMRSNNDLTKMFTSFMGEPTVSLNMYVDAVVQGRRGNRNFATREIAVVACSIIAAVLSKSLVTAPRDDDEEKTLVEKYLATVADGLLNELHPVSLIPIARDAISIFSGYSVERADMSLIQNLYNALTSIDSSEKSAYRKVEDVAGAIAAFLGLPVKNVMRDFRGAYNFAIGVFGLEKTDEYGKTQTVAKGIKETTAEGIKEAVKENFNDNLYQKVIKERLFGTPEEQLYEAIKNNDYAAYEKLQKNEYGGDSAAVISAVTQALADYDERVFTAAQAKLDQDFGVYNKAVTELNSEHFPKESIRDAIDRVYNKLKDATEGETEEAEEKEYSLYSSTDLNIAIETGGDYDTVIEDMIETGKANGKTEEEVRKSIRTNVTKYWKQRYLDASESERKEIRSLLGETGIYDDIENTAAKWVVTALKDEYVAATSDSERNRIRSEIWATGYYDSYSTMNKKLRELLEEEYED